MFLYSSSSSVVWYLGPHLFNISGQLSVVLASPVLNPHTMYLFFSPRCEITRAAGALCFKLATLSSNLSMSRRGSACLDVLREIRFNPLTIFLLSRELALPLNSTSTEIVLFVVYFFRQRNPWSSFVLHANDRLVQQNEGRRVYHHVRSLKLRVVRCHSPLGK